MGLFFFEIISGLCLLALGAHAFIQGARNMARLAHVPPVIIGIVLVGLGTSFPELAVSFIAAFQGHAQVSIGNVVGSNITNMGLVIGLTAMILPLKVARSVVCYDIPFYLFVMVLVGVMLYVGRLSRWEGWLLLFLLLIYLFWLLRRSMCAKSEFHFLNTPKLDVKQKKKKWFQSIFLWLFGLGMVLLSSDWLVSGAVGLARHYHLSELFIGLTIVAVGTALPELAATLLSAFHQEHDIAVGNIIGSNIFNLLAVLAMPALLVPGPVPAYVFARDYLAMIVFSLSLLVIIYLPKRYCIGRISALLLLLGFIIYLVYLVQHQISIVI